METPAERVRRTAHAAADAYQAAHHRRGEAARERLAEAEAAQSPNDGEPR